MISSSLMHKYFSCSVFVLIYLFPANAFSYGFKSGFCKEAKTDKQRIDAPHFYLDYENSRNILKDVELGKKCKEKIKLLDTQLQLKVEGFKWFDLKLRSAEKALLAGFEEKKALSVRVMALEAAQSVLLGKYNKSVLDLANESSKKWTYLMVGVGTGVLITVTVILVVVFVPKASL